MQKMPGGVQAANCSTVCVGGGSGCLKCGTCTGKGRLKAQGTRGAHRKHAVHADDAGGIPAVDVRVKLVTVMEELAHAGDG